MNAVGLYRGDLSMPIRRVRVAVSFLAVALVCAAANQSPAEDLVGTDPAPIEQTILALPDAAARCRYVEALATQNLILGAMARNAWEQQAYVRAQDREWRAYNVARALGDACAPPLPRPTPQPERQAPKKRNGE